MKDLKNHKMELFNMFVALFFIAVMTLNEYILSGFLFVRLLFLILIYCVGILSLILNVVWLTQSKDKNR